MSKYCFTVLTVLVSLGAFASAQGPLQVIQHSGGYTQPLAFIADPLDMDTKFVVQKNGIVQRVTNGIATNTFIDVSASITYNVGDEQGLLGMAFAPDHAVSGHFYLYFVDTAGDIQVARYTRSGNIAPLESRLNIIGIPHPDGGNHNGATPAFGSDGFLYLAVGDGSPFNDTNHNAQNPNVLLGKVLRIDPSGDDFGADPNKNYAIPTSNPFYGSNGIIQAEDEIWAFGVRNPYKYSFDRQTGAMVMGDVGQDSWEEINYEPAGAGGRNYGWRMREGTHATTFGGPEAYLPLTDPILDYGRDQNDPIIGGNSITGGVVYRGTLLKEYQGRYFFADFASRRIWSLGLVVDPITGVGTAGDLLEHTIDSEEEIFLAGSPPSIKI